MSLLNTLIPSFARPEAKAAAGDARPTLRPRYELNETDDAYALQVYLPGVDKAGLEITADEATLTVAGHRAWRPPEGWTASHRETPDADYELTLAHDGALNVEKIHAELADGVLRVTLPKAEAAKPRKIAVA